MTEQTTPDDTTGGTDTAPPAKAKKAKKEEGPFWLFLVKLAVVVLVFRSFMFSPFTIPSESMLPRLWNGDYLFAAKWPYGFTKHSLPFSAPLIPGRILASDPEAGDVVIFKHPIDESDYIKRAIGLPGDQIEMRDGQLVIDGKPVPKVPVDDFVIPLSDNTVCNPSGEPTTTADGGPGCLYKQFRETLPNGVSYNVLDFGRVQADDFGPLVVPEGQVFLMGDNRDNSQDSRFPAQIGGGVGLVPMENLVGRAEMVMWSTDGSASWPLPWTWFSAARWGRMGGTF